jgi:Fe-S-cluster containining protein
MLGALNRSHSTGPSTASRLCLTCGLCCNGALFNDVKLQPGDDRGNLQALGLTLVPQTGSKSGSKFNQPCPALEGCTCRIYSDRPAYCRKFECALLKGVIAGKTEPTDARKTIAEARQRLERVEHLMQALGNLEDGITLRERFRRLGVQLAAEGLEPHKAAKFSELSLAMHDFYLLIRQAFYP